MSKPPPARRRINLPPSHPPASSNMPDHDYLLLEPNGRSVLRPSDGCALSSHPSRPPGLAYPSHPSSEGQLGMILQLLIQLINVFSWFISLQAKPLFLRLKHLTFRDFHTLLILFRTIDNSIHLKSLRFL